jgi:hypothetical protein
MRQRPPTSVLITTWLMATSWLKWLFPFSGNRRDQMAEHHRNQPLCSLLDSDGVAETSLDTGGDATETAAYAGES